MWKSGWYEFEFLMFAIPFLVVLRIMNVMFCFVLFQKKLPHLVLAQSMQEAAAVIGEESILG